MYEIIILYLSEPYHFNFVQTSRPNIIIEENCTAKCSEIGTGEIHSVWWRAIPINRLFITQRASCKK